MNPPLAAGKFRPQCHCMKIRRAAAAVTRHYDAALAPCGVTVGQYSLLVNIARAPGCTISKLADMAELDRSTLTRNLRPLINRGLVLDVNPPDTRDCRLTLTASGEATLECARARWLEAQQAVRDRLGEVGLAALDAALKALAAL